MKLDEDGNYLPVVYVSEFWQMKEDLVVINKSVSELKVSMTYSPISMWKWQMQSQMDQSLSMQDSLSGVEGEGDNFKVCITFIHIHIHIHIYVMYLFILFIIILLVRLFYLFLFLSHPWIRECWWRQAHTCLHLPLVFPYCAAYSISWHSKTVFSFPLLSPSLHFLTTP